MKNGSGSRFLFTSGLKGLLFRYAENSKRGEPFTDTVDSDRSGAVRDSFDVPAICRFFWQLFSL